jgi:hypothetical protein
MSFLFPRNELFSRHPEVPHVLLYHFSYSRQTSSSTFLLSIPHVVYGTHRNGPQIAHWNERTQTVLTGLYRRLAATYHQIVWYSASNCIQRQITYSEKWAAAAAPIKARPRPSLISSRRQFIPSYVKVIYTHTHTHTIRPELLFRKIPIPTVAMR